VRNRQIFFNMVAYLIHDMLFHSFQVGNTMFTEDTRFSSPSGTTTQLRPMSSDCCGFEIILRHTTLCGTPLAEGSACRRGLYMTTHNIPNRQTSMPLVVFKPAIPACKQPQTCTLDCRATRTDWHFMIQSILTKHKGTD